MKASAKCNNYSGCLVAHKGTAIELKDGEPGLCPECKRPLAVTHSAAPQRKKMFVTLAVVLALGLGGLAALRQFQKPSGQGDPDPAASKNDLESSPAGSSAPASTATSVAVPSPASAAPSPEPAGPDAVVPPPRADNTKVTEDVRAEVLRRIDAMPIAREKKDKLYNAVLRAKEMRRTVMIPFGSGGRTLPPREQATLKSLMSSPEIMKVREELTAVFVVLGFADSKGDDKTNLAISADRAKNVKEFLTAQCGVKNITHDVAMGGSKLVDEQKLEKNRIVEVWTVLP